MSYSQDFLSFRYDIRRWWCCGISCDDFRVWYLTYNSPWLLTNDPVLWNGSCSFYYLLYEGQFLKSCLRNWGSSARVCKGGVRVSNVDAKYFAMSHVDLKMRVSSVRLILNVGCRPMFSPNVGCRIRKIGQCRVSGKTPLWDLVLEFHDWNFLFVMTWPNIYMSPSSTFLANRFI